MLGFGGCRGSFVFQEKHTLSHHVRVNRQKGKANRLIRTAAFTVLKGTSQDYLHQSAHKRQAERFETLIEQMKQAQGITEQLKAENALEWVGKMNNIRACAMEIVNEEIIYN